MQRTLFAVLILPAVFLQSQDRWIRVNQLGYRPGDLKYAVVLSLRPDDSVQTFRVMDALTGEPVQTSSRVKKYGAYGAFASTFRLEFSNIRREGAFMVEFDGIRSPIFRIRKDIYHGTGDFVLQYMRQQRSGYNPYLKDSCHTNDGFIIYHPTDDSMHIDVSGGWHDASDYLQYVTTSATAVYQMLFAYQQNPAAFDDRFQGNGLPGSNGIPDILDEAKWGLDWLLKMNPAPGMYFNQIADDRDHRGFRLPTEDTVFYGRGKERPVYCIDGKPQGIYQYKNRTSGSASSVAKFASSFALGSTQLRRFFPAYADTLRSRAATAYAYAVDRPGVSQTAPCRAPYFYEEDNWKDDVELAAAELFATTGVPRYLTDAVRFGLEEPATPWQGADTARHYQWYPFINLGHVRVAQNSPADRKRFIAILRSGIEKVAARGSGNPFLFGIPFIWCSNNLVSALLTQIECYRTLSHDDRFAELESALRDWLFGVNPWGTAMISGLPAFGDTPTDPHSAFSHVYGYPVTGGLVDGPVNANIFAQHQRYIRLTKADPYAPFQSPMAVYHDDWGDYTNNEPTMDGTAGLTMYLSTLSSSNGSVDEHRQRIHSVADLGGIIRSDTTRPVIYLLLSGHEFADGGDTIAAILRSHAVPASFFFTGDFYRTERYAPLIRTLVRDGHYLGGHSDAHLLYAPWERRDSVLIGQEEFRKDIQRNYQAMREFGIRPDQARTFLPPYEWYNQTITDWASEFGLSVINFSPGTSSNADYTTPEMKNYLPSDSIIARILRYESRSSSGLNGFHLLMHIGTDPRRTDKLYHRLDEVLTELKRRGYTFRRF